MNENEIRELQEEVKKIEDILIDIDAPHVNTLRRFAERDWERRLEAFRRIPKEELRKAALDEQDR